MDNIILDTLSSDSEFLGKPGKEHYKLLAYLSTTFNFKNIIDIGTHLGNSSLALSYNISNTIYTFDIIDKNIKTALTTVASLASTNRNTNNSGKPLRLYNQLIDKYGEALPVRRRPIQPIRRRGRPTKQEQQAQRLEQHRLLREEQQQ